MRLATPSATLRNWTQDDAISLAYHANNPSIASNMRDMFPHPYTINDAESFIAMATHIRSALMLAIDVDGEAVGGIGIHPLNDVYRGTAEIGYWLSQEFWGRGIVTDAVRSIIPVAFDRFPVIRLQAGVFESNPASMRVLEKCGFCR
ncbi:MAG: GNAT family N-acetyltransferase [Methanoregula sp.]|jgi:RimJ/RimL family protein N-acetyltransferase